jgi:hypothetical protein
LTKLSTFPEVPLGLLRFLEQSFPDKSPRTDGSLFSFGQRAGEQAVLDLLRHQYTKQEQAHFK